jgi:hypothetical protein
MTQRRKRIVLVLILALAGAFAVLSATHGTSRLAAQAPSSLVATIFTYDGHDFVRTHTTLLTETGKSALNTKLDPATPAFKALVQKQSYAGDVTVFGKKYAGTYAPVTDAKGGLTGALFVGLPK